MYLYYTSVLVLVLSISLIYFGEFAVRNSCGLFNIKKKKDILHWITPLYREVRVQRTVSLLALAPSLTSFFKQKCAELHMSFSMPIEELYSKALLHRLQRSAVVAASWLQACSAQLRVRAWI